MFCKREGVVESHKLINGKWNGEFKWHIHRVAIRPLFPGRVGIWKCRFLWREENRSTWRKTLGVEMRTTNKLNPYMASIPGIEPRHIAWWDASALTTAPSLLPQPYQSKYFFKASLHRNWLKLRSSKQLENSCFQTSKKFKYSNMTLMQNVEMACKLPVFSRIFFIGENETKNRLERKFLISSVNLNAAFFLSSAAIFFSSSQMP